MEKRQLRLWEVGIYMINQKVGEYEKLLQIFQIAENMQDSRLSDSIIKDIYSNAKAIAKKVVTQKNQNRLEFDKKVDDLLTSKIFGFPIMLLMLGIVFWITIVGANYPSTILAKLLFGIEEKLSIFFIAVKVPNWLHDILILGMYRTLAWVVSVMLPPMAIFFPLFTLLEDLGYLPRVAFNLDKLFKKAGAHGKQALTMCMGFGCNAAGVTACRIIESPRERLIAILTNNFVPCNGRFPTLIALATIFIGKNVASKFSSILAALFVSLLVVFGIAITLVISKILTKTILKGIPSSFTLELPPYRKPQIGRIIYTSFIDRTIFVLSRAVVVAAPAGLIIWILANIKIGNINILNHIAAFIDPFAREIGLDGFILMAFIVGLPANEIVIPIIIMSYMSQGAMLELDSLTEMKKLFIENGWNWLTALNVMLFSLLHFPCGTTLWTIKKETGSIKWSILAVLIPTFTAIAVCFIVTKTVMFLGLV
ncbi:nucleoside recognition domain-containing protein [Caminicella sporogenes]|uniref:nucleoside recognition domain-containing protein n=1 Tax=Caminicella sporogenes TaxID=166485 RepID=UPI002F3EBA31